MELQSEISPNNENMLGTETLRETTRNDDIIEKEMSNDLSVMVENLIQSRPPEISPLQCTECGLECPSLSALKFHTQIHVMERVAQNSYNISGKRYKIKFNEGNEENSSIENKNIHIDEAKDIKTMMESLVSHSNGNRASVDLGEKVRECVIEQEIEIKDGETEDKVKVNHGKQYKEKNNSKGHMPQHSKTKAFTCSECRNVYSTKPQLTRHMLIHSKEKRHACPQCEYDCYDKGNLAKHMLTHDDSKPFSCPEEGCDYKCKFKCNLKSHMVKHTGERPFLCQLCDYRSIDKNGLNNHMLSHTGERPFLCTECGKGFATKGNLNVHMRTHTNDKKFKCEHCDYSFFTQSKLNSHTRTHTGEKPYVCEECGLRFTNTSNLNRHYKRHFALKM